MRQSLLTVALLVLAWLAWMLRDLLVLVGFAALLAYALDPAVRLVERVPLPGRRTVPRGVASGVVILMIGAVVGWALIAAVPRLTSEIVRFAGAAPATLARLEQEIRAFVESHGWGGLLSSPGGAASGAVTTLLGAAQKWSVQLLGGVLGNLGQIAGLVLLPLLTFYLLADRRAVRSSVLTFIPEHWRPQTERLLDAIDPALRAYVRGQAAVCLVMGTVMGVVLHLLGLPVALLLGVIVGFAEIIPVLGFWLASAAIALAGYSIRPDLALTGFAAYLIINNLIGYLVSPRLLGREIKMHPFVITVSILAGGILLGPAGSILALPCAAMAQAVIAEFARDQGKRR